MGRLREREAQRGTTVGILGIGTGARREEYLHGLLETSIRCIVERCDRIFAPPSVRVSSSCEEHPEDARMPHSTSLEQRRRAVLLGSVGIGA